MLAIAGCIIFIYNVVADDDEIQETALKRARAHFRDILLTWHWNSDYGGVYVEKKPGVEANDFLEFPDLVSRSGKVYTLRDPDTMSREIADLARKEGDHKYHITSLRLKNPDNYPDPWEHKALESFETGKAESFEIQPEGNSFVFRYMAPMYTEKTCLNCHSQKVYKVGDIHGGISVSFDITQAVVAQRNHRLMTALMLLLALGGVFITTRVFTRRLAQRLTQANRRYEDLLHSTESIVWEADAGTLQFTFVSDQVQRLLGYRPEEWLQAGFWMQKIHPEDRPLVREALASHDLSTGPLRLDYRLFDCHDQVVWMQDVISMTDGEDRKRFLHGVMLDITDRKNSEKRTEQLLAEQNAILQSAMVGIAFVRDRHIVSCNRRFEEIFGFDAGELTGTSTCQLYGNEAIYDDIGLRAYGALAQGKKFSDEILLRHRNGHTFWGAMTGQVVDPEHPEQGAIWIYTDISRRRMAMEEANKLLRAVEQSPVSILITNRNGEIEYVNPRFTQVTGFTRDEAIGQNPRILNSGKTPRKVFESMWSTLLDGREWRGSLCNRRKSGELFWEESSISPIITENGEISHFIAVKEDITQRKQTEDALRVSEDRLKMAMEVSNDGIWDWHIPSGIVYLSQRWQRMLGYMPDELAPCIDSLEGHIHPEDLGNFRRILNNLLAGLAESYETEYRVLTKSGDSLWILGRGKVVERDTQGDPIRLVGTHTDMTERKQAQMELEEHQAKLESLVQKRTADLSHALDAAHAADRAKNEFLANISHEMRTPLNAVIGLSGLAMNIMTDPRQRDYLAKIGHAGQTLLGIINDLLDLSKIAAGRLDLENIPFPTSQIMDRVSAMVSHRLAEKNVGIEIHLDPRLPAVLMGDPLRLEQILLNLVTNAIKFTARGRISIRFNQLSRSADRVTILIDVEDTGIGMSAAEIERLFQPFSQADTSITRTHGGTGLGLTICRRLSEMMGGHIGVTSTQGVGSVFHVQVALGVADADSLSNQGSAAELNTASIRYRNSRALVVDDQPVNRQIVHELLKQVGIDCEEAAHGREAVETVRRHGPGYFDLVLMDIQMPEMDGHSASRAIRSLPGFKELPIIAMTAHAMEHEKLASISAGMNGHLGKPIVTDRFYRLLASWIPPERQYRHGHESTAPSSPPPSPPADELPTIAGLDSQAGLHRFANNRSAYLGWLEKFRDEGDAPMALIVDDLNEGRRDQALRSLHSLKGRVGMLGMTVLWEATLALESAVKEEKDLDQPLAAVRRHFAQIQEDLRKALVLSA